LRRILRERILCHLRRSSRSDPDSHDTNIRASRSDQVVSSDPKAHLLFDLKEIQASAHDQRSD